VRYLSEELRRLPSHAAQELTLSLLHQAQPSEEQGAEERAAEANPEEGAVEVQADTGRAARKLYPINALRNLAVSQARTELVFLLDVDFVPSAGLLRDLTRQSTLLSHLTASKAALVLPAFEVNSRHRLPRQQAALAALTSSSPPQASGFHIDHFPVGHAPTDFARWFSAGRPYEVAYEENFEPYIIASRKWLPAYDERFRGYGLNKVSHLYAVATQGARFLVLPNHFVAAHEHAKSSSWQSIYGAEADVMHRMRLTALWRRFKAELPPLPAPKATTPKVSILPAALPSATASLSGETRKRAVPSAIEGDGNDGGAAEEVVARTHPKAARLAPALPLKSLRRGKLIHKGARAVACRA